MGLIDAYEVLKNYEEELTSEVEDLYMLGQRDVLQSILRTPTVDAEPVRHGRWDESEILDECFWVCSCCKFTSTALAAPQLYKYCPSCGARMDKEAHHE